MNGLIRLRITPAPAGSTPSILPVLGQGRDHPRACGEHFRRSQCRHSQQGSPPRLRGAHRPDLRQKVANWITPAPAGSTLNRRGPSHWWSDHPRACGEHSVDVINLGVKVGSPPRLRGAPFSYHPIFCNFRITPAPAGSTRHKRHCGLTG